MRDYPNTVPALNLPMWQRAAVAALKSEILFDHDGAAGLKRVIRALGHRAEQVALIVWVDAMLEANGRGDTDRPVTARVVDMDRDDARHPAAEWLGRLLEARAVRDRDRVGRIVREAEVGGRWGEYVDLALTAAALTVRLGPPTDVDIQVLDGLAEAHS